MKPLRLDMGLFRLDGAVLMRGETTVPLAPKEMAVLQMLAAAGGRLVTLGELLDGVWPDEAVGPASLNRAVSGLRRRLGREAIRTHSRRGYSLALPAANQDMAVAKALVGQAREVMGVRRAGSLNGALNLLARASTLAPELPDAWCLAAEIHQIRMGRGLALPKEAYASAMAALEQVFARLPRHQWATAIRANLEARVQGHTDPAVLQELLETAGADWLVLVNVGVALVGLGRAGDAIDPLDRATALSGQALGPTSALAWACLQLGRPAPAEITLRAAIEVMPEQDILHSLLGVALEAQGQQEAALASAWRGAELAGDEPQPRAILVQLLARAGLQDEARRELDRLRHSDRTLFPSLLAPSLRILEGVDAAREAMEEAEKLGDPFRVWAGTA